METVVLTIHLILALLLIVVVLLQRNEGGALLSGGGAMTARGAANALTRLTWILATAFICTSIALTILAARGTSGASVIDQLGATGPAEGSVSAPALPEGNLLPPPAGADATVAPPAADAVAPPPAAPAPAAGTTGTTDPATPPPASN